MGWQNEQEQEFEYGEIEQRTATFISRHVAPQLGRENQQKVMYSVVPVVIDDKSALLHSNH